MEEPFAAAYPSSGTLKPLTYVGQHFLYVTNGELWICGHEQIRKTRPVLEVRNVNDAVHGTDTLTPVPIRLIICQLPRFHLSVLPRFRTGFGVRGC